MGVFGGFGLVVGIFFYFEITEGEQVFGEELHFPRADQKALLAIAWCPRDQLLKAQAVLDLSCPYPGFCCIMSLLSIAFLY